MNDTDKKLTLPTQTNDKFVGENIQEAGEPKTKQDLQNIADQRLFAALDFEMKKLS